MRQVQTLLSVRVGLFLLALLLPHPAAAFWPGDPLINVPVSTTFNDQAWPAIVSDGASGAIVVWEDWRSGDYTLYAQRISADGTPLWTADGVALCTAAGDIYVHTITSDGAGGAIVTWMDERVFARDIYARRISADGTPLWTANGVALCTAAGEQYYPFIISDSAGGAIVTWMDLRRGIRDIYAQRVDSAGAVQWTGDGVALSAATDPRPLLQQEWPAIAPDGTGGAIIAWGDFRNDGGTFTNSDIYARRISADGTPLWTADGAALCIAPGVQNFPFMISDGVGGAIVTWGDYRSGTDYDVYAQHVLANGTMDPSWPTNGVALCAAGGDQRASGIVTDGAGGAIVTWSDSRSGIADVYAQHVLVNGAVDLTWPTDGRALCTATNEQIASGIVSDGGGGAIVTWSDSRGGGADIYAQHVLASGAVDSFWPTDGRALCTASNDQLTSGIVADGGGGAIAAWTDYRSGPESDIYAQRVDRYGVLGGVAPLGIPDAPPLAFALEPASPNPTRGRALTVRFALPSGAPATLELLDVTGRLASASEVGSLGAGRHTRTLAEGGHLAPGIYFVRLRQGAASRTVRVAVLD